MPIKTIRLNTQGQGVLVCDQCGKTKEAQLAAVQGLHKQLKIKCNCGHSFFIRLEARRFYRKKTHLPGAYAKARADRRAGLDQGPMTVEDVSRTGLRLRLNRQHTLRVQDIIDVRFTLDNAQQFVIRTQARVVWVEDACVGAAWLDSEVFNDTNRVISTYLMSD